jgi:UDP-N-acetylglucosamine 2-epimerase (non-hydrolysing)
VEEVAAEPRPRLHGLMTRLAYWHFAPTPQAVRFLKEQGCPEQRVYYVRDGIVDATQWSLNHMLSYAARTPETAALFAGDRIRRLQDGRTILIHTDVEEQDTELALRLAQSACRLLAAHEQLRVVWPLPSAPAIRRLVAGLAATQSAEVRERLLILDPPDYPQLIWLLKHTWLVITGNNGIQEEAATLNVPAMILQPDSTGAPVEAGGRVMIGPDPEEICTWISRLAASPEMHRQMASAENPFGDGRMGKHVALILSRELYTLRSAAVAAPRLKSHAA